MRTAGQSNVAAALAHITAIETRARQRTGDMPAPIAARLLDCLQNTADRVLLCGSTPWEIDEAMTGFGFAAGRFEAEDWVGLDHRHARQRQGNHENRSITLSDRMIELGKLGRKTGAGWYRYPGGNGRVDDPIVADLAREEAYFAGIERVDYPPAEIMERLLLALINTACAMLGDDPAPSADEIDLASVTTLGFPRARGGILYFADTLGAANVHAGLQRLASEAPSIWQPDPTIARCSARTTPLRDGG